MYAHTLPKEKGMLGGEVAMWSEYVDEQVLGEFCYFFNLPALSILPLNRSGERI